ncbi:sensory transduction histidine kinase [Labilithrix luteola]|uniref:histidine kinase n=1 Tax=Labilithrix luteola TaxID=1391654 RepID=A0A0K1QG88_9BACT|nr:sensory transduction histidine kinase [Labilithrix luteola]
MSGGPVLVVDDDMVSRHVLGQALAGAKLEHVAVGSGAEALAQIDKAHPSIVLLDLVMPQPDGYQILRILRARPETRDLPVVVLTALEADEEIAKAFEAGADDFVRKPFKPVELVARVRGQLRLRAAMDALARRERDAKLVLELAQAMASNLDFRSILFTVVQRIAEVAKVDRVSIVLVREQEQVGYVVAASDDEQLRDLPIDLTKYPEIQEVLTSGEPLVVEDAATHPLMEIVRAGGQGRAAFASLCILPILYEDRPLGVLFLRSRKPGVFGERELAVCQTIASAMAIALRNARVLQSLRDQTQQVTVARFEAERRMRSLQRYADFFDSSADGIVVIDPEGRLLFANPKAREITGYEEHDLRGRRLEEIFSSDEIGRGEQLRTGFLRGVFPKDVDIGIIARGGKPLIVNVSFAGVQREEGAVLCSFRDVTRQREVEAELVKTKDSLRRVIDASMDAIISCDMHGNVLLFNRAAERIYGKPSNKVLGTDVRALYPEGVAKKVMKLIRDGGGRIDGMKLDIVDSNGVTVPVSFSGALIHDGDTPVGSVGIFTDLREKMRMEQQLQQAQEQLLAQERQAIVAELAGAAAHELNQPLTSVLNYATLLRRLLQAGTPASGAAEVIEGEAERMAEIVRKIGKITKYETKSYVGKQKILDLDRASDADVPVASALTSEIAPQARASDEGDSGGDHETTGTRKTEIERRPDGTIVLKPAVGSRGERE